MQLLLGWDGGQCYLDDWKRLQVLHDSGLKFNRKNWTFLFGPYCLCLRHQPQTLSMSLLSQRPHLSLVAPKAVIQSFQLVGILPLIVLLCLPLVAFKSKSLSCFIPAFVVIGKLESHGAGRPSGPGVDKEKPWFLHAMQPACSCSCHLISWLVCAYQQDHVWVCSHF